MKTSLDHLPDAKRRELERVVEILFAEFEDALAGRNAPHRKQGRILKIILFGSYARGDWVDDPKGGYKSDYDLLVVVNHEELTDLAEYWGIHPDSPPTNLGPTTKAVGRREITADLEPGDTASTPHRQRSEAKHRACYTGSNARPLPSKRSLVTESQRRHARSAGATAPVGRGNPCTFKRHEPGAVTQAADEP